MEAPSPGDAQRELSPGTTFDLLVDGAHVTLANDARVTNGRVVARQCTVVFGNGLSAGWHRFEGRWYDAEALALSSDTTIEFVEP